MDLSRFKKFRTKNQPFYSVFFHIYMLLIIATPQYFHSNKPSNEDVWWFISSEFLAKHTIFFICLYVILFVITFIVSLKKHDDPIKKLLQNAINDYRDEIFLHKEVENPDFRKSNRVTIYQHKPKYTGKIHPFKKPLGPIKRYKLHRVGWCVPILRSEAAVSAKASIFMCNLSDNSQIRGVVSQYMAELRAKPIFFRKCKITSKTGDSNKESYAKCTYTLISYVNKCIEQERLMSVSFAGVFLEVEKKDDIIKYVIMIDSADKDGFNVECLQSNYIDVIKNILELV